MGRIIASVVGYRRVSTDDQAEHGVSFDAQGDKIRAYCSAGGMNLIRIIDDPGASAKSLDRPGMREVLAHLEGGGDGVVIAKLDRLTRSLRDWCELVERFFTDQDGPRLFSCSEAIETRTASGRMVLNIMMTVGQWERETIVERTGQAMGHKRSKGERLGTIPYGSMLAADLKTLVPCPSEVATLHLMLQLRNRRWKLRAIAEELDRLGFSTRTGRPWSFSTIAKLLGESVAKAEKDPRLDPVQGLGLQPGQEE